MLNGDSVPYNYPLEISTGWSIISYLNQEPASVESMMSPIIDDLIIMIISAGAVYWPLFGIYTFNAMYPGEGYHDKLQNDVTFVYPEVD